MLSLKEETVICDTAENESAAVLSAAAAATLSLRDQIDDIEALTGYCTSSQDIVSLAEDRFAVSRGDMHSSEGFAESERQKDSNVELESDKLPKPASNPRNSIPETENSKLSPQRRGRLGRRNSYQDRSCLSIPTGHRAPLIDPGTRDQDQSANNRPRARD